jgi:hypothetical protein
VAPDEPTDATTAPDGTTDAGDTGDAKGAATGDAGDGTTGAASGGPSGPSSAGGDGFDLKGIVRQFATPMLESLDSRLREQVEAHVDQLLTTKLDAALADRLQTIDRAIAQLSRTADDLEQRVAALEHGDEGMSEQL